MNKIFKSFAVIALGLAGTATFTSCEDYLDKEPSSDVSSETPFKNFTNMQGYIEEIYNCIPDKVKCFWTSSWNLGDDELTTPRAEADRTMQTQVDIGNFYAWQNNAQFWFAADRSDHSTQDLHNKRFYGNAWYCIAKANLGIENIDKYFVGTKEEKDMLLGQLYFFRGWWHFEMMQFLGGLPYIDRTIPAGESPTESRLSFQEAAEKCAADFRIAADLLPINWDETETGRKTLGHNDFRLNKIMALGYLGKSLLWAGSPLMENGPQTGASQTGMTYKYNADFCTRAGKAFGELLTLVESGQTQYALAQFEYKNIYDHEKDPSATTCYSDIWWSFRNQGKVPGSTESIFRAGNLTWGNGGPNSFIRYNYSRTFCPNTISGGCDLIVHHPTANYVENYGMANGLPLDDPDANWDKTHPFKDRDPRFYHDIIFDGFKFINGAAPDEKKYCQLYTGGLYRDVTSASSTGYLMHKLVPHTCNETDNTDTYGDNPNADIPYMRLADIYLMYAEAVAAAGGPGSKSDNFTRTAWQAVDVIRDRCGAGLVHDKFKGNRERFLDEVRRERAVELAFEGLRFNDLQRWLLLTEPKYTLKTSHEFTRVEDIDFFKNNDPAEARVADFRSEPLFQRAFTTKHYWFPLKKADTQMYEGFEQNPGW